MPTYNVTVNGQQKEVTVDPGTPLLWVLREELKMTGTKYGCGVAACGACTVHLAGIAARSCVVPISLVGQPAHCDDRRHYPGPGGSNRSRCLDFRGCGSVRILSERSDYGRDRATQEQSESDRHEH
jgi:hypothetical protein